MENCKNTNQSSLNNPPNDGYQNPQSTQSNDQMDQQMMIDDDQYHRQEGPNPQNQDFQQDQLQNGFLPNVQMDQTQQFQQQNFQQQSNSRYHQQQFQPEKNQVNNFQHQVVQEDRQGQQLQQNSQGASHQQNIQVAPNLHRSRSNQSHRRHHKIEMHAMMYFSSFNRPMRTIPQNHKENGGTLSKRQQYEKELRELEEMMEKRRRPKVSIAEDENSGGPVTFDNQQQSSMQVEQQNHQEVASVESQNLPEVNHQLQPSSSSDHFDPSQNAQNFDSFANDNQYQNDQNMENGQFQQEQPFGNQDPEQHNFEQNSSLPIENGPCQETMVDQPFEQSGMNYQNQCQNQEFQQNDGFVPNDQQNGAFPNQNDNCHGQLQSNYSNPEYNGNHQNLQCDGTDEMGTNEQMQNVPNSQETGPFYQENQNCYEHQDEQQFLGYNPQMSQTQLDEMNSCNQFDNPQQQQFNGNQQQVQNIQNQMDPVDQINMNSQEFGNDQNQDNFFQQDQQDDQINQDEQFNQMSQSNQFNEIYQNPQEDYQNQQDIQNNQTNPNFQENYQHQEDYQNMPMGQNDQLNQNQPVHFNNHGRDLIEEQMGVLGNHKDPNGENWNSGIHQEESIAGAEFSSQNEPQFAEAQEIDHQLQQSSSLDNFDQSQQLESQQFDQEASHFNQFVEDNQHQIDQNVQHNQFEQDQHFQQFNDFPNDQMQQPIVDQNQELEQHNFEHNNFQDNRYQNAQVGQNCQQSFEPDRSGRNQQMETQSSNQQLDNSVMDYSIMQNSLLNQSQQSVMTNDQNSTMQTVDNSFQGTTFDLDGPFPSNFSNPDDEANYQNLQFDTSVQLETNQHRIQNTSGPQNPNVQKYQVNENVNLQQRRGNAGQSQASKMNAEVHGIQHGQDVVIGTENYVITYKPSKKSAKNQGKNKKIGQNQRSRQSNVSTQQGNQNLQVDAQNYGAPFNKLVRINLQSDRNQSNQVNQNTQNSRNLQKVNQSNQGNYRQQNEQVNSNVDGNYEVQQIEHNSQVNDQNFQLNQNIQANHHQQQDQQSVCGNYESQQPEQSFPINQDNQFDQTNLNPQEDNLNYQNLENTLDDLIDENIQLSSDDFQNFLKDQEELERLLSELDPPNQVNLNPQGISPSTQEMQNIPGNSVSQNDQNIQGNHHQNDQQNFQSNQSTQAELMDDNIDLSSSEFHDFLKQQQEELESMLSENSQFNLSNQGDYPDNQDQQNTPAIANFHGSFENQQNQHNSQGNYHQQDQKNIQFNGDDQTHPIRQDQFDAQPEQQNFPTDQDNQYNQTNVNPQEDHPNHQNMQSIQLNHNAQESYQHQENFQNVQMNHNQQMNSNNLGQNLTDQNNFGAETQNAPQLDDQFDLDSNLQDEDYFEESWLNSGNENEPEEAEDVENQPAPTNPRKRKRVKSPTFHYMSEYSAESSEEEIDKDADDFKKTCRACGADTWKIYFGKYCCEGCRTFFYRSIKYGHHYTCLGTKSCVITAETRNACKYCRLKKCLKVGMVSNPVEEEAHLHIFKEPIPLPDEDYLKEIDEIIDSQSRNCSHTLSKRQKMRLKPIPLVDVKFKNDKNALRIDMWTRYSAYLEKEIEMYMTYLAAIPRFRTICPADRGLLIKRTIFSTFLIRHAPGFSIRGLSLAEGALVENPILELLYGSELAGKMKEFAAKLNELYLIDSDYGALVMLVVTQPFEGREEGDTVAQVHEFYCQLMRFKMKNRRCGGKIYKAIMAIREECLELDKLCHKELDVLRKHPFSLKLSQTFSKAYEIK